MPLQVDHARPVRTVDTKGNVVSTDTSLSAPIKTIDSVGRAVQTEAAQVAAQAAASNPEVAKESAPAEKADAATSTETTEAKPTEAEIRKAYLDAQKARRKAQELERKARDGLTRAEAFEAARKLAETGEDPTAILKAAGIDHVKFYQDMTRYALSDKAKAEEDPVKRELREHKERLDTYKKELDEQQKKIQEREDLAVHNQVIADKVVPLLRDNPEKYEALFAEYGANAAVEVYRTVWDIYQKTGVARSFQEVADEMESYWTETIGAGITAAARLKKFQGRFAQNGSEPRETPTAPETPKRSVTLSNKPSVAAPPTPAPLPHKQRVLTRDERVAEILERFKDVP